MGGLVKQMSIYFPADMRAALDKEAFDREVSVAELVRTAVGEWLAKDEVESAMVASMDEAIVARMPDATPIAPPLSAVTTQRQAERCYHIHADGVTRWHLNTIACPSEANWAAALERADLASLPAGMVPEG